MVMSPHTQAKIYLNDRRACEQTDTLRIYHSLGTQQEKNNLAGLSILDDVTLKGGHEKKFNMADQRTILLLPIVGELHYKVHGEPANIVNAGECQTLLTKIPTGITIKNCYESELINFVIIGFDDVPDSHTGFQSGAMHDSKSSFDLGISNGRLVKISESAVCRAHLGKFAGRDDHAFSVSENVKGIFAFVIEGAFEFENRLLEYRDALSLRGFSTIEFEALSENAILLILEVL
jgi:hypothetical protein